MICPILSQTTSTVEEGDIARTGTEYVECKEKLCAWWITGEDTYDKLEGCAVNVLARKTVV